MSRLLERAETAMLQRGMTPDTDVARLSDGSLLVEVKRAAANERRAISHLIALLGEVDSRRLYLGEGCSSLFTYCTQVLRLSDDAAYFRMEAARAARSYPVILELLADGALTVTAVRLLRPHLTPENHREVLDAARHRSKRQVEELVARLRPQPAIAASVRKLPAGRPSASPVPLTEHPVELAPPHSTAEQGSNPEPIMLERPTPKPPVVKPLAPNAIKSSSQYQPRRIRSYGRCKICCATACRMAIPPRSSTGRSRCCSSTWSARSLRLRDAHARNSQQVRGRATSRPL